MPCQSDVTPIACAVAHHVPGRLRLKLLPSAGEAALPEACRRLMRIPVAVSATPNPVTGSIVFRYDPRGMAPAMLCDSVRGCGLSPQSRPENSDPETPFSQHLAGAVASRFCEWVVESLARVAIAAAT